MKIYASPRDNSLDQFIGKDLWVRVINDAGDAYYLKFVRKLDMSTCTAAYLSANIIDLDLKYLPFEAAVEGGYCAKGEFYWTTVNLNDLQPAVPLEVFTETELLEILRRKFFKELY